MSSVIVAELHTLFVSALKREFNLMQNGELKQQ